MARTFSQIENDALRLSNKDRSRLIEHLLATLDPGEDEDVEELWLQEAERRYEDYRRGKIKSKPAQEVFADARKNLL